MRDIFIQLFSPFKNFEYKSYKIKILQRIFDLCLLNLFICRMENQFSSFVLSYSIK